MITGIKQQTTVGKDGKIEIPTSELPEGAIVQIIVLLEEPELMLADSYADLLAARDRLENRQDLITFTSDEWNAKYNL